MAVRLEAKYCLKLPKTLGSNAEGGMLQTDSVLIDGAAEAATIMEGKVNMAETSTDHS